MADDFEARLDALIKAKSAATIAPESIDALADKRLEALKVEADAAAVSKRRAGRSTAEELVRQVGLTARAAGPAASGAAMGAAMGAPFGGLPGAAVGALGGAAIGGVAMPVADIAVNGFNYATGKNVGLPSRAFEQALTAAGLPEPETPQERIVQGASRAVIDTATGAQAARTIGNMVPRPQGVPTSPGRAVVDQAAENVGQQTNAAALGAGTAGAVVEAGGHPLLGMAAGAAAGSAPYMTRPANLLPDAGPEQARLVNVLEQAGVPVSPGQRANSPFGRVFESVLKYLPTSATRSATFDDNQMRAYTRSVMRHAGLNAETADPATLTAARQAFGNEYNILEASTTIRPDRQFLTDLRATDARYRRGFSDQVKNLYEQRLQELTTFATSRGNPQVDGVNYHALQSQLAEDIKASMRSTEPTTLAYGRALRGLSDALEGLVERSAGPGQADAWRDLNRRYAVFSVIEDTMATAGQEKIRTGFIPPAGLGNQVRGRDGRAWAEERNPFAELTRAGAGILPDPVPNSGTAQRSFATDLATGFSRSLPAAGAGIGAGAVGLGGLYSAGAALAGPYAASRMWYGRNYTMPEAAMIGARSIEGASDEGLLGPRDTIKRDKRDGR
ncbi:MAG: hypothetical protein ACK51F_05050 [Rhodospirillales bacterium]